jgi:hypothetical protein
MSDIYVAARDKVTGSKGWPRLAGEEPNCPDRYVTSA